MRVIALFCALTGIAGSPLLTGFQAEPTPGQIALGDSVFHGKVGGALCYVCHGPGGKGVAGIGPNLTDQEWLNADGTVASIEKVVTEGVAKPKKMPTPMPAKGGGQLTEGQIKAVALYVYSLSHPTKR